MAEVNKELEKRIGEKTEPVFIDLTPQSLKTPEGAKRVNDALRAFDDSSAAVANAADTFFRDWKPLLVRLVLKHKDCNDRMAITEDIHQLEALIGARRRAQETFVKAIGGR